MLENQPATKEDISKLISYANDIKYDIYKEVRKYDMYLFIILMLNISTYLMMLLRH